MLLWFLANAAIGAWNISKHGASAFQALSPHYMYYYWSVSERGWRAAGLRSPFSGTTSAA